MGLLTRVKDQMLGQEQPIGFQAMTALVASALGATFGALSAVSRGNPWLDGALICGGPVLASYLLTMLLPRVVGLLRERRRSRDR